MNIRTSLLLFVGACIAACGGKTIDTDSSGTTSQQAKGGKGDPTPSSPTPTGTTTSSPPVQALPPANRSCEESGSSASGGPSANGGFECSSETAYQCSDGDISMKCSCTMTNGVWNPGQCGCSDGTIFTYDCSQGCQPGATEQAKCHLPTSGSDFSSSGDGFSSSGGSSGH